MTPVTRAFRRFFAHESAGGILLAIAALAALLISNSPWGGAYQSLLQATGEVRMVNDALVLSKPLVVWINDLWMAIFFLLVGLEIKREFMAGELSGKGQLTLPAAAALGGMAVPALIYTAINWGDPVALQGWAIPAATDIAFALGIALLLGDRVPLSLKVFLTAVAIIDDLGAIIVIALFYTHQLSGVMLAGAALVMVALWWLNRLHVDRVDVYLALGLLLWLLVLKSGVHATLAGVVTALAIPMQRRDGQPLLRPFEHGLHPWVAFLILPTFAFANAGVSFEGISFDTLWLPIPLGIAAGLLLGKTIGVYGMAKLVILSGLAPAPTSATSRQLLGVSILCGIGFTMSLFIGGLAFAGQDPAYITQLKIGVLGGSLICGLLGTAMLWRKPQAA